MNKLTIYDLNFYRLQHPNGSFVDVARRFGVSPEYAHELWTKNHPGMSFNQSWGAKDIRHCKTCGKEMSVSLREIKRGGGK